MGIFAEKIWKETTQSYYNLHNKCIINHTDNVKGGRKHKENHHPNSLYVNNITLSFMTQCVNCDRAQYMPVLIIYVRFDYPVIPRL